MDIVKWKYVKPLKNKSVVQDFLIAHKIKLPDLLVKCIIENNGGRPSEYLFDTCKRKGYVFQSLFSYNEADKNNIYKIYSNLFADSDMYPLGLESAGNVICYDQKDKKYVLWNHEKNVYEDILGKLPGEHQLEGLINFLK